MNTRRTQQGLSLIELMVGLAIGLVIVAAALLALTQHLRDNSSLLVDTRLMHDLRTSAELIANDVRRAGPLVETEGGVRFSYPGASGAASELAYRLRDGVIEMKLGEGHWQAMTDVHSLRVLAFSMTPHVDETVLTGFCSQPCAEGSTTCPPRQLVRSISLYIEARAPTTQAITRSVRSTVRIRNDALSGACPS